MEEMENFVVLAKTIQGIKLKSTSEDLAIDSFRQSLVTGENSKKETPLMFKYDQGENSGFQGTDECADNRFTLLSQGVNQRPKVGIMELLHEITGTSDRQKRA